MQSSITSEYCFNIDFGQKRCFLGQKRTVYFGQEYFAYYTERAKKLLLGRQNPLGVSPPAVGATKREWGGGGGGGGAIGIRSL